MKITVTKEETIEKATPFFTMSERCYYAFYNEDTVLQIHDYPDFPLIVVLSIDSNKATYPEITAKEFEAAYIRVSERFNDLFEQERDKARESKGLTTDNFQVTE